MELSDADTFSSSGVLHLAFLDVMSFSTVSVLATSDSAEAAVVAAAASSPDLRVLSE